MLPLDRPDHDRQRRTPQAHREQPLFAVVDRKVAGYTPIVLMIMFFGGLTALGLGVVGQYLWLTLQNARAGGPASSFDLSSRIRLTNRGKSKHKPNTFP